MRSAAYNLGALQVLQDANVLRGADYLASVSGGSYIAAAATLTARDLPVTENPFEPGSPEARYLRHHTTYLAPSGWEGLFFVVRLLLGLLVNALILALAIGIPAAALGLVLRASGFNGEGHSAPPGWAPWAVAATGGLALVLGLAYVFQRFKSSKVLRFMQAATLAAVVASAVLAFALLLVPLLVTWLRDLGGPASDVTEPQGATTVAVPAVGIATVLAAIATQVRAASPKNLVTSPGFVGRALRGLGGRARVLLLTVAGGVVVPLLVLVWIVLVVTWVVSRGNVEPVLLVAGACIAAGALVWLLGDINSWSLHQFYRSRLATAFALRRVGERAEPYDLYSIPEMSDAQPAAPWPRLVVCAAANASGIGVSPHGRRVTPFTFEHDRIGGPAGAYRATAEYEQGWGSPRTDVMNAVAVSGAAVSPSMGKLTQPAARALLALANVRLGVWLPNPRADVVTRRPRRPRPHYLLFELLGINSLESPYLYVTDGGHYENLGLVELLRRGCTRIYCFDASSGATLEALGDAVALARAELGIEIDIDPDGMVMDEDGFADTDCAVGTITYPGPDAVPGWLVYTRQLLTYDAPYDVIAHAQRDPGFPHDPIANQFFTDQRFEAYRVLGATGARHALGMPPL